MEKHIDRAIFSAVFKGPGQGYLSTLSDSFKIRPPSIYRAPGIARPCRQMGHLAASEIQCFYPILLVTLSSPGGRARVDVYYYDKVYWLIAKFDSSLPRLGATEINESI